MDNTYIHNVYYFNSRPHEEVDVTRMRTGNMQGLFQLTTSRRGRQPTATGGIFVEHFNSRPHEEVDLTDPLVFHSNRHFNSRPHEEVDNIRVTTTHPCDISTHDLTKRSTRTRGYAKGSEPFQLTTSRRGRQYINAPINTLKTHFNSRPHEEVDSLTIVKSSSQSAFQLTTSRRGRQSHLLLAKIALKFQLTTSRRGRHILSLHVFDYFLISTHDLTKRSTSIN